MVTPSVADSWIRINQAGTAIAAAFGQAEGSARRAAQIAEEVRALLPTTALSACILKGGGRVDVAVLDQSSQARPDLAERFLAEWSGESPPGELRIDDQRLLVEPAVLGERVFGALAVSAPVDGDSAAGPAARAVLAACCRQLALHLELAERQRELDTLRDRLAEESTLAAIGELAGPVVHEFNNLLNTMLLQVAVMEQKVDVSLLPDLRTIRRQGAGVIALVKQWQQCRRRPPAATQPALDVNALIEETLAAVRRQQAGAGPAITLELAPQLPALRGPAADFRRLVTFLLNNAVAVSGSGGVGVRTEAAGDHVVMRVEDVGPGVAPAELARLFEPLGGGRPGTNRLELAACRTLVRRFQGKIHGENRPTGGVTVVVELPAERL